MSDLPTLARHAAARHVLTGPTLADRSAGHLAGGHIDWIGIAAETATMSGGERFLVDVARRLWSGRPLPGPYELRGQLDPANARRVAEAIAFLDQPQLELAA